MRDFFWLGYFLCSLVKRNFFIVGILHKLGLVLLLLSIQNFEHLVVLVSIDFPQKEMSLFIVQLLTIFLLIGMGFIIT